MFSQNSIFSPSNDAVTRKALESAEEFFKGTGILDLRTADTLNLSLIGQRPTLKILDLSYTKITSLEGLPPQEHLAQLNLQGSRFNSLFNFKSVKNISKINISNTPFAKDENSMLSLVVAFGSGLRDINGKSILKSLSNKAKEYPELAF